jgi:hypothetical protein
LNFEQQNKREFHLELEVLTKYVTVMLLIVLVEAALRCDFIFKEKVFYLNLIK